MRVRESERVRERERIDCDDSFRNQSISIEVEASPGKKLSTHSNCYSTYYVGDEAIYSATKARQDTAL